jgi:hypothetical protein
VAVAAAIRLPATGELSYRQDLVSDRYIRLPGVRRLDAALVGAGLAAASIKTAATARSHLKARTGRRTPRS